MNKQTYKQQQPYQVRYPVRLKYTNVFVFIIVAENFKLFMQEVRWLMYINWNFYSIKYYFCAA